MGNTCKVFGVFLLFTCGILNVASAQVVSYETFFVGTNGEEPELPALAQDIDGSLNGTAPLGGAYGEGVTFKWKQKLNQIDAINSFDVTNGDRPVAGVILASDGTFYGASYHGGANSFLGLIFRVTRDGSLHTVNDFETTTGVNPTSLMQGIGGRFYGTTDNVSGQAYSGTVFAMSPAGVIKTLHQFDGSDGALPEARLIQDSNGTLYGSTYIAGNFDACDNGCGTIFKLTADGTFTTLHVFDGDDGNRPNTALVQASDGNFYGTTEFGGTYGNGTLFRITADGKFETLYSFCGMSCGDGKRPNSLIQGTDGNLYGTTQFGGTGEWGTLFESSLDGTLSTLYSFTENTPGLVPFGLTQSTDGKFYGVINGGGRSGWGGIFQLDMGLQPFVTFVLKYGSPGQTGKILGQGFTGATDVSVNGTPATFTVVSDTYIKATIPQGATSGYVSVTTPSGVLTSNVPFTVIP